MPTAWFLAVSALGGLVAGVLALLLGGLGVFRLYRVLLGAMAVLTESIDGIQRRVEREIKTRAGERGGRPSGDEQLAQEILARAAAGGPGGGARDDRNMSRAEIARLADRR